MDIYTVMFADIAGSTKLYEQLGDLKANQIISEAIDLMQEITQLNLGIVIKTIGDEVMCRFSSADNAAKTAIQIQEKLELSPIQGTLVSVKIGFHTGSAILQKDGDLFGDSVNVAARMASIAKNRQIILTKSTANLLTHGIKVKVRDFDKVQVKGKSETLSISELVWENVGVTKMISVDNFISQLKKQLVLKCHGKDYVMDSNGKELQLGRSQDCDLVINADLASRYHAKIEIKRGNFVLIDQSTNGTYVRTNDDSISYLRRDEIVLKEKGVFSLGTKIEKVSSQFLVSYEVL